MSLVALNSTTNGFVTSNHTDYYQFPITQYQFGTYTELIISLVIVHHGTDSQNPSLTLFLNNDNLADPSCYIMSCVAQQNSVGNAYCILVVDPCELQAGNWSVSVVGDTTPDSQTHYTLNINTRGTNIWSCQFYGRLKLN